MKVAENAQRISATPFKFSPKRKSTRRLCQPPGTRTSSKEPPSSFRRGSQVSQNQPTRTPAALRERGVWGERRFSQRSGLSPQKSGLIFPQTQKSPAALSAAENTHIFKGNAPPPCRGNQVSQNQPTRTPAALRERGVWWERRFSQRSGLSHQKVRLAFPKRKSSRRLCRRREHAHLQRNCPTPSQGEPSQPKPTNSNPSRSSEERGLGRGASLREAASPPRNSHVTLQS